jgi:hypothetical protein
MALPDWAWAILAITSDKNKGKSLFIIFLGYYDFVFGSADARRLRVTKPGDSREKKRRCAILLPKNAGEMITPR